MRQQTVGFEVVVRFYPGAEAEAYAFYESLAQPDQAASIRLDRVVTPDAEERITEEFASTRTAAPSPKQLNR